MDIAGLLEQAKGAYRAYLAAEAEQTAAAQAEQSAEREAELTLLRAWMNEWLPAEMWRFVGLGTFTASQARRYDSRTYACGMVLYIELPDAAPIMFRAYRGQVSYYQFGSWPHYGKTDTHFAVPTHATVKYDDDNHAYLNWDWPPIPQHADILTAAGHALQYWQDNGERLAAELGRERFMRPAPEPTPATVAERTAAALERIADSLEQTAFFS